MNVNDTSKIPFPKTHADLAALDAARETPYLKALCNRRGIHIPNPNPAPSDIIPHIQARLDHHIAVASPALTEHSGDYIEWKLIRDDLSAFLAQLRSLANDKSSIFNDRSTIPPAKTSGHSNNSDPTHPKNPAIQTNQIQSSKTPRHSNNSPEKNTPKINPKPSIVHAQSGPIESPSPITNHQSSITNHQPAPIEHPTPQNVPPQIPNPKSSIVNHQSAELPHQSASLEDPTPQKLAQSAPPPSDPAAPLHTAPQQLVHLCQSMTYSEASAHAREKLAIQISPATLCNLCTTWQIADDNDTRAELESAHNTSIENLTQKQLQLRLLELASRPNMDHTELRAMP